MFSHSKQRSTAKKEALIYQAIFTTSFIVFSAGSILLLSSLKESNGNFQKAKLGVCLICIGWSLFSFSYLIQQFSKDARDSENAQPVQRLTTCNGQLQEQLLDITSNGNIVYLEIILILLKEKNTIMLKDELLKQTLKLNTTLKLVAEKVRYTSVEEDNAFLEATHNYLKTVHDVYKKRDQQQTLSPSTAMGSSNMESVQPTGGPSK